MAIVEVKVPQLSESVAEATLLQWKKKVGEAVAADEILIDVETDKVVLEVPAPAAGVIAEIVVADGGTVVAEQLIARIDTEGKAALRHPLLLRHLLQRLLPHLWLLLLQHRPAKLVWPCLRLPS